MADNAAQSPDVSEGQIVRYADVPVEIEVEMDRRILTMREILALREGSLIGTTRSAGENIDIYIGGALVGFGEIVVIENMIGVRITDFRDEE
jgi:flagellar motor switch protein FliN/FliY